MSDTLIKKGYDKGKTFPLSSICIWAASLEATLATDWLVSRVLLIRIFRRHPLTDLEKQRFDAALRYTMLVLSVWAHVKKSRGEMGDELFQRVGNYYRASYEIPRMDLPTFFANQSRP